MQFVRIAPDELVARAVDMFDFASDDERRAVHTSVSIGPETSGGSLTRAARSRAEMGIYDREYYRGETRGSGLVQRDDRRSAMPSIVINVAIFLLQNLAKLPDEVIGVNFAASVEETFHHYKLWQLVTAAFFHDGLLHLFFNMWFFWIVAREMEPLYGSRDFLAFYLGAAVFSTLIWLLFAVVTGQAAVMIGASSAVTAVATLFTLYYPKREMIFIVFPMPMWALLLLILGHDLIPVLSGRATRVAVEAHLAGAGFALLFKQFDLRWSRLVSGRLWRPRLRVFSPVPRQTTSRSRSSSPSRTTANVGGTPRAPSVSVLPEEQLDARLDEVLAKIAREGRSGLTEEELRVLQEASRRAESSGATARERPKQPGTSPHHPRGRSPRSAHHRRVQSPSRPRNRIQGPRRAGSAPGCRTSA